MKTQKNTKLEGVIENCGTTSWVDGDKIEYETHFQLKNHAGTDFCLKRVPLPIHNGLYAKVYISGVASPLKQDFNQIEKNFSISSIKIYNKKDGYLLHTYNNAKLIKL